MSEKKQLMKSRAFSRFYPDKKSEEFMRRLRENWLNLQNPRIAGDNSAAAWFYLGLGSGHYKVTVFAAWLVLCLRRPWERMSLNTVYDITQIKGWRCHLSEKFLSEEVEPIFREITECQLPDLQTLRRLISKRRFREKALWFPLSKNLANKRPEGLSTAFKNWARFAQLFYFIKTKRHIIKSELMRKFGLRKKQCDRWLQRLADDDLIRIKEYPNRRTFIVYIGPENL